LIEKELSAVPSKGTLTLVLGGVRSGKSRFAQDFAFRIGCDDVLFVATAEARDLEMKQRIDHHRQTRSSAWKTLEAPLKVGSAILKMEELSRVVLLDCLTLLVSNIMCSDDAQAMQLEDLLNRVELEVDTLMEAVSVRHIHLIVVSGEVGLGVVPDHAMGRLFRDLLGWANQRLAKLSTTTYWMVAGLPIDVTSLACSVEQAAMKLVYSPTAR